MYNAYGIAILPCLVYNNHMGIFRRKAKTPQFKTYNFKKTANKYKMGLALSGGGARGFAHIGVMRAFAEHGLHFDYVAGTSVGSIMGAAYCAGYSWEEMREFSLTVKDRDLITARLLKINNSSGNIEKIAQRLLNGLTFEQMQIPFACVAVDLISGNEVVLNSGDVAKAVSASCAVPAIFTPVEIGNMRLVDGGVLNNIPADVVRRMGADKVISVDLNHTRGEGTERNKFWSRMSATWRILMKATAYKGQINSDIIIEPELRIFSNSTIKQIDEMIDEGYRATINKLNEIDALLK